MGCVIKVNHPNLTKEEREYRMEQLKKATISFYKEVERNKRKALEESEEEA